MGTYKPTISGMAVKLEGPLTKWTNVVQGWQYRWFVLDENTGLLSYYTSKDKMMRGARRGCLRLKEGKIGINDEDDSTFTITCDHRTFHFQARDAEERTRWVRCLEETIAKHSQGNQISSTLSITTEEELNKRMQEAEIYFRLLTQQAKNLESKINHSSKPKSERSLMLKDSLTQMIETMGQTIELLHNTKQSLAKRVPVPVIPNKLAIPATPSNGGSAEDNSQEVNELVNSINDILKPEAAHENESIDNVEVACEMEEGENIANVLENQSATLSNSSSCVDVDDRKASVHLISIGNATVPINSYTSSDEEDLDEFFDAPNEFSEIAVDQLENSLKEECQIAAKCANMEHNSTIDDCPIIDLDEVMKKEGARVTIQKTSSSNYTSENDEDDPCEYDEDDPCDDGDDLEDMQQHGSVITHLLSQVRIGMDLTKVTLPTFILERRSLLEMYADFFAHPDLFKGIADFQDPADRMIQVLKWYLSSFHAGRKGNIAKKPYNPILGEIFQCFYDLTENKSNGSSEINNAYGTDPVPWANDSDVSFLAEQVSHHPPISAFYAECKEKRICFNSHIWTKSKFLGLSIGVHNVGTGNVFLLDHDEEYVMTFPNGYGRSILTIPWIELGGKTEITCKASGYSTQLEFHTKPFYGGKKNRVTAEVFAPNQKKPIMSVYGEWNGVMFSKFTDAKEADVFVDTCTMPTVTKKVRSLGNQEEFESRKMWQDVTRNLKLNNIEGATEGKHKLEEKQRQDARMRKETNSKWVTRFFDEWEEDSERIFYYKRPLYSRLGLDKPGLS